MGSQYYSNVQKALSQLDSNSMKEFTSQKTDFQRVDYIRKQQFVKHIFTAAPRFEQKSSRESMRLREEGNEAFRARNFQLSIELYTKSILYAPFPDAAVVDSQSKHGLELAMSLGNRSASLFQQQRWREALDDIRDAFKFKYPSTMAYKLLGRQARCLCEIGRHSEAQAVYRLVQQALKDSDLLNDRREEFARDAERHLMECSVHVSNKNFPPDVAVTSPDAIITVSLDTSQTLPSIAKRNHQFHNASDFFSIQYTSAKGHHGVATRNVTVGEYVIVEMPHVCVLDPKHYSQRCYHCFKLLYFLGIGCQQCATVRYCGDDCRKLSWAAYHSTECQFLSTLLSSNTGCISLLIARLFIITDSSTVLRLANQSMTSSSMSRSVDDNENDLAIATGDFSTIYSLLSHSKRRSANELLQYTFLAIFITELLKKCAQLKFPNATAESNFGSAVLRLLQIASCNAVEITEMGLPVSSRLQTVALQKTTSKTTSILQLEPTSIGLGLFPTVSFLNHSCNPSLELIFHGCSCAARIIRPVKAGNELTIDYGLVFYSTPRAERQESLYSRYYFDCVCDACTGRWELKNKLKSDIPLLKCQKCGEPAADYSELSAKKTCANCGEKRLSLAAMVEEVNAVRLEGERAVNEARKWNLDAAICALENSITKMDKLFSFPWKDYVVCMSTLKQCYRLSGNRSPALTLPDKTTSGIAQ